MSPMRRWLFVAACVASFLWALQVAVGHMVRLEHQILVAMIRSGEATPSHAELERALFDYQRAFRLAPCNAALHADRALLVAYDADRAMALPDAQASDAALHAVQKQFISHLACNPRDGKVWLDLAALDVVREGMTPRALAAYRMSALAAPGESWLAKKRLEFALAFLPVLTAQDLSVARADLAALERAHPNNMTAIQTAAQVENKQALYALFGGTAPTEVP